MTNQSYIYNIIVILCFHINTSTYGQSLKQKKSNFYNITEIGYGTGIGKINFKSIDSKTPYDGHFYRLRTQFGYIFTDRLTGGIGFGLDGYHNFTANTAPFFLYIRHHLTSTQKPYFIFGNMGYSVPFSNNFEKGYILTAGVGKRINTGKIGCFPSIGFNLQQIQNFSYFTFDPATSLIVFYFDNIVLKTITINLGFMF
jgi:hypothetical protein